MDETHRSTGERETADDIHRAKRVAAIYYRQNIFSLSPFLLCVVSVSPSLSVSGRSL